jgi:hypothetical protein
MTTRPTGTTIEQLKEMGFSDEIVAVPRRTIINIAGREKCGKCLTGDCTVLLESGKTIRVDQVRAGDRIASITPDGKPSVSTVNAVSLDGIKPVWRIVLSDGRRIKVTSEHKLLTPGGWMKACDVSVGGRVLVPSMLEVCTKGGNNTTVAEAAILGYLLADGGLTGSPRFTNGDEEVMCDFMCAVAECGFSWADYTSEGKTTVVGLSGAAFRSFRDRFDLYHGAAGKYLVPEVMEWPEELLDAMLQAYFTCDGWFCETDTGLRFGACSASKTLIGQITSLLLRRGIPVNTRVRTVNGTDYWDLDGSTRAAVNFTQRIGFTRSKQDKAVRLIAGSDVTPGRYGYLALTDKHGRGEPVLGSAGMWAKVKSIDSTGLSLPVWDIEITGDSHCFVANNILVHNSHMALTGPPPVVYFDVDIGTEGVVSKFQTNKQVLVYSLRVPKGAKQGVYAGMWSDLKLRLETAWGLKQGTVVLDTSTEAWELARLAHFGKLTQILPHNYVEVNNEWRALMRCAYDSPMTTVLIHKQKAKYVNNTRTGEYELSGFGDTEYMVQTNLVMYREDRKGGGMPEYCGYIQDCRQQPALTGSVLRGEMLNMEVLLGMIHDG